MLKALFALVAAALFAGGALYSSLVEGSRGLGGRGSPHARHSYGAATALEAGLALASFVLGLWAWWKAGDDGLLIGALLIGAVIPLTLFARWGRLHALRTLLAIGAVTAYLIAFLYP